MLKPQEHARRLFLGRAARLLTVGAALPLARPALAALPNARSLEFAHTHTGERLSVVFAIGEQHVPEALNRLNLFLRDHYSGEVGNIDPQLFELLFRVRQELGCEQPFQVISGYRCAGTNSRLRNTGGGGVARQSLHMQGKAIDIRLPGSDLLRLHKAAVGLKGGGVGLYRSSNFIHVDTGRVRYW